jgi:diguanylate cyclase (GGDEF)-like protein/PAS domain S-box-containing protein
MRSRRSLQPLVAGLVAGMVAATLVVAAYQVWKQRRLEGVRNEVLGQLSTLRARLESELNSVIHVTDGMVTYVVLNPDMGETEFQTIARMLLDRKPGLITHFTAAPDNIIRFLHPEEGNQAALGLDLARHPEQGDAVRRMMETGDTVLAGPWELVQGGERLVVRNPVYIEDSAGERRYWGLVSIPVDMPALYGAVDLEAFERHLRIAIRGRDGRGAAGGTFHGDAALFGSDSLRQLVTMLGGSWELAAEPRHGWGSALGGRPAWWVLGALFTLLSGLLAGHLVRQGRRVRDSEHKYRALMEDLSDGACIIQDGWLRFVNPRLSEISGHDRGALLSHRLLDFVVPEDREALSALESRLMTSPVAEAEPLEAELRIARRNGESGYVRMNLSRVEWDARPAVLATVCDIDERKRLVDELHDSHARLEGIIRALPDIAFILDSEGRYLDAFGGKDSRFYHEGRALVGRRLHDVLPQDTADRFLQVIREAIATRALQTLEYALTSEQIIGLPPDGAGPAGTLWFEGRIMPMGTDVLDRPTVIWLASNITARKRLEESLRLNARVFEDSSEGIFISDADNRIIAVNGAFTRITGYEQDEVLGRNPSLLASGIHEPDFYEHMWAEIDRLGRWEGEIWNQRKDGRVYPQNLSVSVMRDSEGRISHHIAIFSDITRRKEAEAQIRHMALHDNLTGLANRVLLRDRLDQAMEQARRDGKLMALLFIDLDDFKPVNDRLGHDAGDQVLREVARRLRGVIRRVDTVARVGGDEFVIVLQALDEEAMAHTVAEKLIRSVEEPIFVNGDCCVIGASVGVSLFPLHGGDHNSLMQAADKALYEAKAKGKNRYQLCSA